MAPVRIRLPDDTSTDLERFVFVLVLIAAIIMAVLWPTLSYCIWHDGITKGRPHIKRDACYLPLALAASVILGLLAVPLTVTLVVVSAVCLILKSFSRCCNTTTCCGRPFSRGRSPQQDLEAGVSGNAPGQHERMELPSGPRPAHQQPAHKQPSRQSDAAEQDSAASVRGDQSQQEQKTEPPPPYSEAVWQ